MRRLSSNSFRRSLALTVGGNGAAQLITIAFSPLITRLYGPETFGVQGMFVAIVTMIAPFADLMYGTAIVLPSSNEEARVLFRLSVVTGVVATMLSAVVFGVFFQQIADAVGFTANPALLLLVPIGVMQAAVVQPLHHWLYRTNQFGALSSNAVVVATMSGAAKTAAGTIIATPLVLIILGIFEKGLQIFMLWRSARDTLKLNYVCVNSGKSVASIPLKTIAYRFRDFPLFRAPQQWIIELSYSIPLLMLAALLEPAAVGLFLLARRIILLPNVVIGRGVGNVFLTRLAEAKNNSERLQPLLIRGTAILAMVGLLPLSIVTAFGPSLFGFFFGDEWARAGEYARWLSLGSYFAFLAVPCRQVIPIIGLQGHSLLYQITDVILRVAAMAVGILLLHSDIAAVAFFSIVSALVSAMQTTWCLLVCDTYFRKAI